MAVLTLPQSPAFANTVRAKALVFEDPRSRHLLEHIELVAPSSATVLIIGETGTGKEIVARHVHELSLRAKRTFAAVNCGALSETLVEGELFGHERGAFTGADRAKAGWFETANGGTLFLDEVGDLPMSMQVKLLRVLQESEVVRVGSRQPIPIDVRLIAATNVDLERAIEAGNFREDLYYRLHVTTLRLLPLRERPGDIPPLAHHFANLHAKRVGLGEVRIAPDAEARLLEHHWPGNIRELENVLHNAVLVCRSDTVRPEHLHISSSQRKLRSFAPAASPAHPPVRTREESLVEAFRGMFEEVSPGLYGKIEDLLFRTAFDYCDQNQLETARLLGISRNIVRARLAQHGHLPPLRRALPDVTTHGIAEVLGRVRVGFQRLGLLPLVKAQGRLASELKQRGIDVEWFEYPAGRELFSALEAGLLDLGVVGGLPPISAQAAQVPFVYVAAEAPAPDAEAIVVHEDSRVASVFDLAGKRVALSAGSSSHYLLMRALEEAQLGYDAIDLVFGSPADSQLAFLRREVDAWAVWDPWLASVQRATRTRVLRDAYGLASNASYYIARTAFADAQPEIVHTLVEHVTQTGRVARQSPDSFAREVACEVGLPCEGLALALSRHRGTMALTQELLDSQQTIADSVLRMQLIPRAVSVADARWKPGNVPVHDVLGRTHGNSRATSSVERTT